MITSVYSDNRYSLSPGDILVDKTDKILAPIELPFWWGFADK